MSTGKLSLHSVCAFLAFLQHQSYGHRQLQFNLKLCGVCLGAHCLYLQTSISPTQWDTPQLMLAINRFIKRFYFCCLFFQLIKEDKLYWSVIKIMMCLLPVCWRLLMMTMKIKPNVAVLTRNQAICHTQLQFICK